MSAMAHQQNACLHISRKGQVAGIPLEHNQILCRCVVFISRGEVKELFLNFDSVYASANPRYPPGQPQIPGADVEDYVIRRDLIKCRSIGRFIIRGPHGFPGCLRGRVLKCLYRHPASHPTRRLNSVFASPSG
jgi:hypothetical protein